MSHLRLVEDGQRFLPYGRQAIDETDIAAVAAILRSDFLTTGPAVDAFEAAFAETVAAPHAIACANGTAALHLAMLALDLKPGDCVIAPSLTFLATANAARFCGADVVFADVDPVTALMTPDTLAAAFVLADGKRVRAVLPVHYAGNPCDLAPMRAMAEERGAVLVEDACHALGTTTLLGNVGDAQTSAMSVFSFHPVKTIATGEGGMVTTRDSNLAARLRQFRSHGMVRAPEDFTDPSVSNDADGAPAPWAYEMQALGYNYRLSDIHAALGLSQLKKLAHFKQIRRDLVAAYCEALKPLSPIAEAMPLGAGACPHLAVALIDFEAAGITRGETMRRLRERGIGAQVHYIPVHRQPYYRALYGETVLPGAEAFYARCLSLPLFATMTPDDVAIVAGALKDR